MSAPAPAALQNLRSLVFRDHALNLKQKIIFRRAANRMVQKNDIRARPVKLLDEKHLMCIAPGEPVRGVDIDSRDDPSGHSITQLISREAAVISSQPAAKASIKTPPRAGSSI